MRIVHVSDLHIRNFKYRREYSVAFENLYRAIGDLAPDLVVNTGDLVHSKLAVSPELVDDVSNHLERVAELAPYWVILGNHDLNLKNPDRIDAISPIVRSIGGRTKHELSLLDPGKKVLDGFPGFTFWHFDIREKFVGSAVDPSSVNVGLFHGSIAGCVSDAGKTLEGKELDYFDGMDYVLMGDIHKRQSFRGGRIAYPGSLIQQNYGEELVKGFLVWDIESRDLFSAEFVPVDAPGRFFTVRVPDGFDLGSLSIPCGSRIRAFVDGDLSPSRRWELEKAMRERFDPIEVITPDPSVDLVDESIQIEKIAGNRDDLMLSHLQEKGIDDETAFKVIELFASYEKDLGEYGPDRGTSWSLESISWDDMLNYGPGNIIDLKKIPGLVGIFAPNTSGKSSIFDILLEALFDKVPKDVPRNIDLVNDNKDEGSMTIVLKNGGSAYKIDRKIERIHYGQRKLSETKQWGKTSLDFSCDGVSLNGDGRPETEKAIRKVIGTFEDFVLTSMVTQSPVFGLPGGADIVNCRETDRRKILFRFLDLDLYEKVNSLARDELKELMGRLKGVDRDSLVEQITQMRSQLDANVTSISDMRAELGSIEASLFSVVKEIEGKSIQTVMELARKRGSARGELNDLSDDMNLSLTELGRENVRLSNIRSSHSDLLSKRPTVPSIPLTDVVKKASEIRSRKQIVERDLTVGQSDLKRGKRSLQTLDGIPCEGKFPTCRFISEAMEFIESKRAIEESLEALRDEDAKLAEELADIESHEIVHRATATWERSMSSAELEISKAECAVEKCRARTDSLKQQIDSLSREIEDMDLRLQAMSADEVKALEEKERKLRSSSAALKDGIDSTMRLVGAIEAKIESKEADLLALDGIKEKITLFETLAEMTGKGGLPYRILAMVLPVINAEMSKILSGIVKFTVFFDDDPETQSVGLYIRYGDYKSRPLGLGSGAEKFIASLAARVALLSVSSLPKTDILVVDEGFGKLDPEHLESLQKMFEYLRQAFRTVFIISHVDFMRDIVDHSIEITSRDGYAHVEV